MQSLAKEIQNKKILLLCGTGGIGKTSISSAIALSLASSGKRVGLITIDPAKRLATAMGLNELTSEPKKINKHLESALKRKIPGALYATAFDSQKTLEKFILNTGGKEKAQLLNKNTLFQLLSHPNAGTHDYLVMEELYTMYQSNRYDTIVLDTPPTRNALEFLDAPEKIGRFFDDRIFQWFLTEPKSKGIVEYFRAKGTKTALNLLSKITGEGALRDLMEITPQLYPIKHAFLSHQSQILQLLKSKDSGILFITTPESIQQQDLFSFWKTTTSQNFSTLALIVNRSLSHLCTRDPSTLKKEYPETMDEIHQNYVKLYKQVQQEKNNIQSVQKKYSLPTVLIPEVNRDINSIEVLEKISTYLTL